MGNVIPVTPNGKGIVPPPSDRVSVRIRRRKTPAPESVAIPEGVRKRRRIAEPLPVTPEIVEAAARPMRADGSANRKRLAALVQELSAQAAHPFEGHVWAGPFTQDEWAERAGISTRTFRRLIASSPFVSSVAGSGAEKRTMLRLGTPHPPTPRKVANTLAKTWKEYLAGRSDCADASVSRRDYGILCALAREWPDGWQVKIFKHVLADWTGFMVLVSFAVELTLEARVAGVDPFAPDVLCDHTLDTARRLHGVELTRPKRLNIPSLAFLNRFLHLGLELYEMQHGDIPPPGGFEVIRLRDS